MKMTKSLVFTLVLVVIAAFIHIYANDSTRVENQYSTGFYPAFSRMLRYSFGWLPFSMGDVLYGLVILWLIWKLVKGIKIIFKRQATLAGFAAGAGKTMRILLVTYIVFNLFWGINYNRMGIASQLQLKMEKYQPDDLKMINGLLVEKVNTAKLALVKQHVQYPSKKQLFVKVQDAYKEAEKMYPFLKYQPVSLKPSVWSWVGNYMGFTGYYNPFTGEAQVNTLVPKFLQPFTSCHEVAHQLGYAKEMEANFVGYLSATASKDTLLHYSVYLDLFMYSNRNLFATDSVAAKDYRDKLAPAVIDDLKEWRAFYKKHKNPIEPVFRWIYGKYLEGNQQPQGVLSYDEVTGFIIAYYKKYGKI
ncbi:MAG: DUF3810 domain-containing protein [Chitinophagaceae bacterium]|nr:DUF3810 domain-containing protein [Chitinophagaceae bacterium]